MTIPPLPAHLRIDPQILAEVRAANIPKLLNTVATVQAAIKRIEK